MHEMRFPLNNSRPARLDDLPTSQAAAEQTLTRARTHTLSSPQLALVATRAHLNTQHPQLSLHQRSADDDTVSLCCCSFNCLLSRL